jgi:hypothetical protein
VISGHPTNLMRLNVGEDQLHQKITVCVSRSLSEVLEFGRSRSRIEGPDCYRAWVFRVVQPL